jgi:CRISPR/Cas system-associated endonuclease Cas1
MPVVFLTTPGTRAFLVSERLRIEIPPSNGAQEQLVRDILLIDIEHVVVHETTHITVAAMTELLRRNIPIVLSSSTDTILGLCLPPAPHSVVRIGQYRKAQDASFALDWPSIG